MMTLLPTEKGLMPLGPYDAEVLSRFTVGVPITVAVEQDKSTDQLNLYWGFIEWCCDNCEALDHMEKRSLSDHILMTLGYIERYTVLMGGGIQTYPRSIGEMDRQTFDKLCKRAFDWLYSEFELDVEDYKAAQREKSARRRS